jgi:hypothetical protein
LHTLFEPCIRIPKKMVAGFMLMPLHAYVRPKRTSLLRGLRSEKSHIAAASALSA